jgi:hypothetical protein
MERGAQFGTLAVKPLEAPARRLAAGSRSQTLKTYGALGTFTHQGRDHPG